MAAHLYLAHSRQDPETIAADTPIRVVLADDHALMRHTLRLLLDGEDGITVIAEAQDLSGVTRHVGGHRPQVLVLDLSMPDGSSLDAISRLRERAPATQIVAMTMNDNPLFAQRALAAGAIGFVAKELADEELPRAVRAAGRGEVLISPRTAARLDALPHSLAEVRLTPREGGLGSSLLGARSLAVEGR